MKKAIITGASSGLGKAIAIKLAQKNIFVILLGQNNNRLKNTLNEIKNLEGQGDFFAFNLKNFDNIDLFVKKFVKKFKNFDFLINNAGVAHYGFLKEIKKSYLEDIDINLKAHIYITGKLISLFNKNGHIINISSIMNEEMAKGFAVYRASKFGLEGFNDSLKKEVYPKIKTTLMKIAAMDTNFHKNFSRRIKPIYNYRLSPEKVAEFISYLLLQSSRMNISEVKIFP